MSLKIFISLAWRNLWRSKRRTFITVSSVSFAVLLSVFAESMNNGSHENMIKNMVRFTTGYVQIQEKEYRDTPSLDNSFYPDAEFENTLANNLKKHNAQYIPRIDAYALAAGNTNSKAALVMGIEPDKEFAMYDLRQYVTEGEFFDNAGETAVIGSDLANSLGLSLLDTIVIFGQGKFGNQAAGKFVVGGILKHPLNAFNERMVYLSISQAQWLFVADQSITSLLIMCDSESKINEIAQSLKNELDTNMYNVFTWQELQPDLVKAIEFDKAGNKVLLFILYMVVSFGIFGTVLTMTLEREKEFAVMLSIGMHRFKLAIVSFLETIFISLIGVFFGLGLGFLMVLYFYFNPIPLSGDMAETMQQFGMEPILPFSLTADIFYQQAIVIFMISCLVSLYPIYRVFKLSVLNK